MAKYTVCHTCGHSVVVELFGPYKDRERRIAYMEACECEECRRAKHDAIVKAAKAERGLAELTGTEKQVAWADSIREKAYRVIDMYYEIANTEKSKKIVDGLKEKMDAETTAKFWIDNRYNLNFARLQYVF